MRHIGAISGGKDSVCMAVYLTETHSDIKFEWVCTPTGNEPPEWFAHMRALRERIGVIKPIMVPGDWPYISIARSRYLAGLSQGTTRKV